MSDQNRIEEFVEDFAEMMEGFFADSTDYRVSLERLDLTVGDLKEDKQFFKDWAGFDLICPDIPKGKSLVVKGSAASMISSLFSFKIERCDVTDVT